MVLAVESISFFSGNWDLPEVDVSISFEVLLCLFYKVMQQAIFLVKTVGKDGDSNLRKCFFVCAFSDNIFFIQCRAPCRFSPQKYGHQIVLERQPDGLLLGIVLKPLFRKADQIQGQSATQMQYQCSHE